MESVVNRIVEGKARVEDFELIELVTHGRRLDLSIEFSSILRYSLLKHPHYSLMRNFEGEQLSTFQIFSLIVNKQDDNAKQKTTNLLLVHHLIIDVIGVACQSTHVSVKYVSIVKKFLADANVFKVFYS